jgi:RimJ/RimL family protein N-acetyltransferase
LSTSLLCSELFLSSELTFIILQKLESLPSDSTSSDLTSQLSPSNMIGDVNLFIHHSSDDIQAELEIMIPSSSNRRQGIATSTLKTFISYSLSKLDYIKAENLVVKMSKDNEPSRKLFQRLGFEVVKVVEVFNELEMRVVKGKNIEWEIWKGSWIEVFHEVANED